MWNQVTESDGGVNHRRVVNVVDQRRDGNCAVDRTEYIPSEQQHIRQAEDPDFDGMSQHDDEDQENNALAPLVGDGRQQADTVAQDFVVQADDQADNGDRRQYDAPMSQVS